MMQGRKILTSLFAGMVLFGAVGLCAEASEAVYHCPEMNEIVQALCDTSELPAFEMDTSLDINLKALFLQGNYHLDTEIEVIRSEDDSEFQMNLYSTDNFSNQETIAGYQDGIYYYQKGQNRSKYETNPEDILYTINEMTDLVSRAGAEIEEVEVVEEGDKRVCTFAFPLKQAESYVSELIDSLALEDFMNFTVSIQDASFVSTMTADGLIEKQEVYVKGKVHKLFFSIPVNVSVAADFSKLDKTQLNIATW